MHERTRRAIPNLQKSNWLAIVCSTALWLNVGSAEPVRVRYTEGILHGFLELQTLEGKVIANGEITQVARESRVHSRLVFRFKDGSLYDDSTIFSQHGTFRLLSDHLIEKGPSFKEAIDATIDAVKGQVTVRSLNKDGKQEVHTERMDLPADLANGLLLSVFKDIPVDISKTTLSLLATAAKPRLVTLEITPEGDDAFSVGTIHRKATHFVVKIKIGGIAGLVAPLIGKQPPDMHIWVVHGPAPAVIRMEGPLYEDGPVWRMQMSHPPVFKSSR